ncbi:MULTISPECIES: amidase [Streptomyces]|uniref:Amidase n=2 Tax=Streptomyces TaxID=1883 RepID=A0ABV9J958_9ACTN
MDNDIAFMSAIEIAREYRSRNLSPVEVVDALINRIEEHNPKINAFVTTTFEAAREEARHAEQVFAVGSDDAPPLLGIPVTVKDLTPTAGVRTTYGSLHFADHVPTEDGVIWARLKAAGAVLLGKTTTPEFGGHTITESPLTGITNNPWDLARTTGGSSGGAAAALAAGFGPLAVGSDGGGSIRVPSSFCGVVGLKASIGRIPRYPEAEAFESVGAVGPMTRTVADNALMLSVVAGPHSREPYSLMESGVDYLALAQDGSLDGVRVAVSPELGNPPIQSDVREAVLAAADVFGTELGAAVSPVDVHLPDPMEYFIKWWGPIIAAGMGELLHHVSNPELTHPLIRSFVKRADGMSAEEFAHTSIIERQQIHEAFASVFDDHELLIWATTPTTAFPHPGPEGGPLTVAGAEVSEPALDNQRLTEAIAHAGYPAISIPCGFDADGLPIGLQIAGRHGQDAMVLRAALAFESERPWAHRRPAL